MSTTYKNVSMVNDAMRYKNCFLCDVQIQSTPRNIDRLFHVAQKPNGEPSESLAITLSAILDQNVDESTVHSKVVCRKCQSMCIEYDAMNKRLNILRQTIVSNHAETANKYNVRVIEMDYHDNFDETSERTEDDAHMSNMYTIESEDGELTDVLHDEPIEPIEATKPTKGMQMKKVVLVKPDASASPFFAISDVEDMAMGDNHAIQTVLLEDIDEAIEYSDSATNTNDCISDGHDTETGDHMGDFVGSEHLDSACEEYFQPNGDQMIEINANGEIDGATYQFMYDDDSSDQVDKGSGSMLMGDVIKDEDDDDDDDDPLTFGIQRAMGTSKKSSDAVEQKQLFIRDGMNFQCCLCVPRTNVVYDTKTISIHLKSDHNERIYVCSICGLDFRKRNPYNEHMDDHMAEAADGAYECEICKTVFSSARQFRIHKKTHNASTKIWSCKACGKKYSSKNLLDEHMNMHTGEYHR